MQNNSDKYSEIYGEYEIPEGLMTLNNPLLFVVFILVTLFVFFGGIQALDWIIETLNTSVDTRNSNQDSDSLLLYFGYFILCLFCFVKFKELYFTGRAKKIIIKNNKISVISEKQKKIKEIHFADITEISICQDSIKQIYIAGRFQWAFKLPFELPFVERLIKIAKENEVLITEGGPEISSG